MSYGLIKSSDFEQYSPLYGTSNNPLYRDGISYTSNNYLILMKNLVIYMIFHCIEIQSNYK